MDALYYLLVITATVLFSLQFLFTQKFGESRGSSLEATLVFTLYKSVVIAVMMFIIGGVRLEFTLFSALLALVYTASGLIMTYFSLKAFEVANLSVYSVFSMLGGMLLPFLLGIFFYDEGFSVAKTACCVLILVAVLLGIEKKSGSKKAMIYYLAVFILNGMAGVISKIHQSSDVPHVSSTSFMILSALCAVLICGVILLVKCKKIPFLKKNELLLVSGYGVFNGVGNLFLLIALASLPASVQYPLVTGGVMVISTLISAIRKEKLTLRDYIATALAFAAAGVIIF